jgi:mRNA-degrading endonuclease HigB of HigAB toxin-antitoxin module
MRKTAYFNSVPRNDWPSPEEIKHFFLPSEGRAWFSTGGNDGASFRIEGLYGTGTRTPKDGRVDAVLYMTGHPDYGAILSYQFWDGRKLTKTDYSSKGDLTRLNEYVTSLDGTKLPLGLFVPFTAAWVAVKEFLETDGELPKSIEWVRDSDLSSDAFPVP